jgi:hypothetical protein
MQQFIKNKSEKACGIKNNVIPLQNKIRKMITEEINYFGVEMTVEGNYHAGESQVMYDSDMAGYPGSGPEFELFDVFVGGISILNLLSYEQLAEIESEVIEKIEG